jgi:hypothetical protein
MSAIEQYRAHAHECLQRAHTDEKEGDKPLWLTLAQSWLQLAEHADRADKAVSGEPPERESETADVE